MSGLYVHFPFCNSKCIYCSFYSVATLTEKEAYLKALLEEIELKSTYLSDSKLHTIYFGGGTPSLFSPEELKSIIDKIHLFYTCDSNLEFTIEANPEQCSLSYLKALKGIGVNRLSIGIQSFNDDVLQFLGRKHDSRQAINAVQFAKEVGFDNISIDLIYGILNRKIGEWQQDLDIAFSLPVQHISAYALTVDENTKLFKQIQKTDPTFSHFGKDQDEELALKDMKVLLDAMVTSVFKRYEVSNFAIPGFESQHNSNYWNGTHYLGLGASAHSFNGHSRSWNVASLTKYMNSISQGTSYSETELLTPVDLYNETIMLGIRTSKGIDLSVLLKKHGELFYQHLLHVLEVLDSELYDLTNNMLTLTAKGFPLTDYITEKLFLSEN